MNYEHIENQYTICKFFQQITLIQLSITNKQQKMNKLISNCSLSNKSKKAILESTPKKSAKYTGRRFQIHNTIGFTDHNMDSLMSIQKTKKSQIKLLKQELRIKDQQLLYLRKIIKQKKIHHENYEKIKQLQNQNQILKRSQIEYSLLNQCLQKKVSSLKHEQNQIMDLNAKLRYLINGFVKKIQDANVYINKKYKQMNLSQNSDTKQIEQIFKLKDFLTETNNSIVKYISKNMAILHKQTQQYCKNMSFPLNKLIIKELM